MSGKGKNKKKGKSGALLPAIRISQCMIVKNEEKNIEKALSWAKGIAFEQIVVDTGSTDRTAEIAESIGAKVFHFEWINDFAAAKNYAIEQATGNWIAFLDADEHLSPVDAKKLMLYIKKVHADPETRRKCLALQCKWSQVDDMGKPFAVQNQTRVFRNIPEVRYVGAIHEYLSVALGNTGNADEITIIHTGYSSAAYEETGKAGRNITLLREELKKSPDDAHLKIYLADSLVAGGSEIDKAEAIMLYREALESGQRIIHQLKKDAYMRLLSIYINSGEDLGECEALCRRALEDSPGDMDYEFALAIITKNKGEYREAWELLKAVEAKLLSVKSMDTALLVTARPDELFGLMADTARLLGDDEGVVRYAAMALSADKSKKELLDLYIATLKGNSVSDDDVLGVLAKLYELNNPNDLLLVARAAKDCGAKELALKVVGMIKT